MHDTQNQSQNPQDQSFTGQGTPTLQNQAQSQVIPAPQPIQFSNQDGNPSQVAQNQQIQSSHSQNDPSPSGRLGAVGVNQAVTPGFPYNPQAANQTTPTPVTDSSQVGQIQSQGQMPQSMSSNQVNNIPATQAPYSQQDSNPAVPPSGPQSIQSQPGQVQNAYTSQDQNQTSQSTGVGQFDPASVQSPYPQQDASQYSSSTGGQVVYGQVQDPYTTPDDDQTRGPVSVHTGTPESAPMPVAPEASTEDSVEYGYEKLKQIENGGMELEKIENKESLSQQPQDEIQTQPKQEVVVPEPVPSPPPGPKIFGYQIPQSISSNLSSLRAKKGTGDPQEGRTWIYVLLDKLLKKQTYQNETATPTS